jgi:hypothetical protein
VALPLGGKTLRGHFNTQGENLHMTRNKTRRFGAAVVALSFFAAACGGDDAADAPADEPAAEEPVAEEPAAEETATNEPAAEEPAAEEPADDPNAGTGG